MKNKSLKKFAYLSIVIALIVMVLKFSAYIYTGSVGLLSDALETIVNLIAATIALIMIHISEKPADERHEFGHSKAEYFSSAIEGGLIFVAATSIIWFAIPRLINQQSIQNINIGLVVSFGASVINFIVAKVLINNGKKNNSLLLIADGKHLMTDVWTSAGVIAGIVIVKITGLLILDPIIAILVAINILWTGYKLIKDSANGLMDVSIPQDEIEIVENYLSYWKAKNIKYHSLMTRQAGRQRFISLHLLMPGEWTVQKGHDIADIIEEEIEEKFNGPTTVITHIEPIEDPASQNDIGIYRTKK